METWQRVGVYSAGMALTDAGIAGNAELLDHTDMIVAAGGGERDIAVDTAILAGVRKTNQPGAFLNERLMSDLRPTLFLAQLPNLLAGNISLVHGVVGSSRTFMGEEAGRRRRGARRAGAHCRRSERADAGRRRLSRHPLGRAAGFRARRRRAQGQIRAGLGSRPRRRHRLRHHGRLPGAGKLASTPKPAVRGPGRGFPRSFPTAMRASPAKPRPRCAGSGMRSRRKSTGRTPPSFPAPPASSPRPRPSVMFSRTSVFRFAIPVRISGMGSIPSSWPIWASAARRSSTASCSPRPGAAIPAKARRSCRRSSSPASAIGAAKGLRCSNGSN